MLAPPVSSALHPADPGCDTRLACYNWCPPLPAVVPHTFGVVQKKRCNRAALPPPLFLRTRARSLVV
ncbi:hypothetical protein D3C74_318830 [compost metagenome]